MPFEKSALPEAPAVSLALWSRGERGCNALFRKRFVIHLACRLGMGKAERVRRVYEQFAERQEELKTLQENPSLFGGETPERLQEALFAITDEGKMELFKKEFSKEL